MADDEDARRQLDDLRAGGATDARSRLLIDYFTAVIDEQQASDLIDDWQRRSTALQQLRDDRYAAALAAARAQADTEKGDWSWRVLPWRKSPSRGTPSRGTPSRGLPSRGLPSRGLPWRRHGRRWFERVEELLRPQRDVLLADWRAEFGAELRQLANLTAETRHRRYDAVRRKRLALRQLADLGLTPPPPGDVTDPADNEQSFGVVSRQSSGPNDWSDAPPRGA